MKKLIESFHQNNLNMTNESVKSIEFEHKKSNEVVYLLPNKEMTIVLHPNKVSDNEKLKEKSYGINHNTSFRKFPKRKNTGKNPINYGYSFKFQSLEELNSFLVSNF